MAAAVGGGKTGASALSFSTMMPTTTAATSTSTSDYRKLMAENASLRVKVSTLREVIDVLLDGMGRGTGGYETHPLDGEEESICDVGAEEVIVATRDPALSASIRDMVVDLFDDHEDGVDSAVIVLVDDNGGGHDDASKEEGRVDATERRKRGSTAKKKKRRTRRRSVGSSGSCTGMMAKYDNLWKIVAGGVMSFPTKVMPALAMVSIVAVMIVSSIVRAQGIGGGGGGGMLTRGGVDVNFDGGDENRAAMSISDNGPPPDELTMKPHNHVEEDGDYDDITIIKDGYSSPRILLKDDSTQSLTPIAAPTDAPAPVKSLFEDATWMPTGVTMVGIGRPESDSLFDASAGLGQKCVADPERCGCPDVYQTDYRGSINTTRSGQPCMRWDDENLHQAQDIIMDGFNISSRLEEKHLDSNFCRNPRQDREGTWCYVGINEYPTSATPIAIIMNYCNVPVCDMLTPTASPTDSTIPTLSSGPTQTNLPSVIPSSSVSPTSEPSSSSVPTLTLSPTQQCKAADKTTCGCEVAKWRDYRGTINKTILGPSCERWDSNMLGLRWIELYPDAGLDENFCRSPDAMSPYCIASFEEWGIVDVLWCDVPKCDPCSCTPPCGEPNQEKCGCPSALQAEACCEESDSRCRCFYLKDACHKSLQNNSTDFCDEAQVECCKDDDAACTCGYWKEACEVGIQDGYINEDLYNRSWAGRLACAKAELACCTESANPTCVCDMYDQICSEYQSESICQYSGLSCCTFESQYYLSEDVKLNSHQCRCDFYTYTENVYGFKSENKSMVCSEASIFEDKNKYHLKVFYNKTGGDYWYNNTGWLNESVPVCHWFGLTCNDDDLLVKIELKNNNLTGTAAFYVKSSSVYADSVDNQWPYLRYVKVLDVSENNLSGRFDGHYIRHLLMLEHIDISKNSFTGYADMLFSPTAIHANFSHNNFIGVSFKRFNPAYKTLKVIDLRNNNISQDSSEIFLNVPPNLDELVLSNNAIEGKLPNPFPCEYIRRFVISNNFLNGDLPDFPSSNPLLRDLDLSNQGQAETGGFTGTIPIDMFKLSDLIKLDLSRNSLTGPIPSSIGNLVKLEILNLSINALDQVIPSEIGKLDALEVLDLSRNKLDGRIPSNIGGLLGASVYLQNNPELFSLAPLTLCSMSDFDLNDDIIFCPTERNALKEFFESAKGGEWTMSVGWMDEYTSHCEWYGIKCNEANNSVRLQLQSNGLSGTLTPRIGELRSLETVNLNNNNMKGKIPTEIGLLSNLTYLRLSYNEFTGNETSFGSLQTLKLIHLHGNRLSGTIPTLQLDFLNSSSYVSDCGNPSDFNPSLRCDDCTMCCNSQSDCYPLEDTLIQDAGFDTYGQLTLVFIGGIIMVSLTLALASFAYDRYKYHIRHYRQQSLADRDKAYALETLGINSVYQFFVGKSICGWTIVVMTISAQFWLLTVFVESSERDLSDDKVDMVYFWKCTRDSDVCFSTTDLNWKGWVAFFIMMFTHLSKDVINGVKLVLLSGKEREDRFENFRFFIGGTTMVTITLFTLFVSTIYNDAIATSNTEILVNSVVIILVTHIDELMYSILVTISPSWVASMALQQPQSHIHQSPHQQPPHQQWPYQKPPQAIAGASGGHDNDGDDFANDDVDSLERETIPLETVKLKAKSADVCEVESGAAANIS